MKTVFCVVLGLALWTALRPPPSRYVALDEAAPKFGAASYFENNCARCHGEEGINYSVESLKKRPDASLRGVIHDMADGPGQAPLDEKQLDIETAWHRTLIAGEPWLQIVKIARDGEIIVTGEASIGAKVSLQNGENRIEAKRDGVTWTATLPANCDLNAVQVLAERGETKTVLKLDESAFSAAK